MKLCYLIEPAGSCRETYDCGGLVLHTRSPTVLPYLSSAGPKRCKIQCVILNFYKSATPRWSLFVIKVLSLLPFLPLGEP